MPSPGFDINAYGNPRAQAQRKKTDLVHESAKPPVVKNTSPIQHRPPSQAPSALSWPSAKIITPLSNNKSPHTADPKPPPKTVQSPSEHPHVSLSEHKILRPDSCQTGALVQSQQKLSVLTNSVNAENPSTVHSIEDTAREAINKLDLEPENMGEGGVPLSRIDPHFVVPKMAQTNGKMDAGAQLKQLQDVALKQIARRSKNRQVNEEKYSTTSLKDLDLARTPINPNEPLMSRRPWAQGSPVTESKEGGEYLPYKNIRDASSQIPEASWQMPPSEGRAGAIDNINNHPQALADHSQPHDADDTSLKERITSPKRSKWASKESMAPEKEESNSNAWGSANPSDVTRGSNVSDKQYGKLLNSKPDVLVETTIADWDGNFLPAPADWSDRPRFNNNNPVFKAEFDRWLPFWTEAGGKARRFSNDIPYTIISEEQLMDLKNHADGISMVERTATVNLNNAAYYGYTDDPEDAIRYSRSTDEDAYRDWGKLDPTDPDNIKHYDESCQDLINGWLAHLALTRAASATLGDGPTKEAPAAAETANTVPGINRTRPKLNIYLRPVTKADLSELTRIYNWHITNTTRPVETREISEADMRQRLEMAQGGKLPFIVAAKRSQKGARAVDDDDGGGAELFLQANLLTKHRKQRAMTRIEQLAGFCCAQEFTAADFVEHISAELDIYVDVKYKRMGVGRCLMDKMLEICDRAHMRQTECTFYCDRLIRHQYGPGGGRDLHKLLILVRKWHTPKAATISLERGQRVTGNALAKTNENEYESWQKSWLERLGFEVEGTLKKAGAKFGRYLDIVYLARETSWAPDEGQIPDPFPGFAGNNSVNDEEEEDEDY
ncbi:hypothetical protein H2198_006571 [Neophaeococcomyces mojaviensis]|uniref:Uncharacterized protein n=1 Tax=Neophaeococcomyces mojaviensis TaxID=3383035 RepID=A0ACC3A2L9_9EURO|nr:hypothetical protein H2198_006571 [Knufia sp. JES_112]